MIEERMAKIRADRLKTEAPTEKKQAPAENDDLKDEKSLWDAHVLRQSQPGHKVEKAFTGTKPVKINTGG